MQLNYELEKKLIKATVLMKKKDLERAENAFAKIAKDFPDSALAWLACGEFYIHQHKPAVAVKLLKKAVKIAPEEGMVNFVLGVAFCKCARFYLGLKYFENADRLMPQNSEVKRNMGFAKIMLGRIEEGRKFLREAIKLEPINALPYIDLGVSYMKVCDFDEALKCFETAKALAPGDKFVLVNLREAKRAKRDFSKLTPKQKEKYIKADPDYHKKIRIELLLSSMEDPPMSVEDVNDIIEELKSEGLTGEIAMFRDPKTPEGKAAIRYVSAHKKISERKLTEKEIKIYGEKLFDKKTPVKEKEKILITLAHQKNKKALEILERYDKKSDPALKFWAKMAVDECRLFLGDKGEVRIHRIDN